MATTNINLQSPPSEIDGVSLSSGVTVLLIAQKQKTEQGLYITSPWSLIYKPTKTQTFTILQGTKYANAVVSYNSDAQSYSMLNTLASEIVTDDTLQGEGSIDAPLGLAPNGALTGDVMTYNGAKWKGDPLAEVTKSAGENYDSWETGVGVQGWAATSHTISYDGRVYNTSAGAGVGDSYEWTMGSNGTLPSVLGQFYRFRFTIETANNRGIVNISIDDTVTQSIDAYGTGGTVSVAYTTDWYQATNTSMKFQVTVTGKAPASSSFLFVTTSLGIDVLSHIV